VDFDLFRGEVHALLGENGAGKSTLMKILSGAYSRDGGEIWVDGHQVDIRTPRRAQILGISTIYQELNLVPYLSVAENIFLGNEPERFPGIIDRNRLFGGSQSLLDELGVAVDARTPLARLSVAERQMVEVAKALSVESRILIMDEPTSALTESEIEQLFTTIGRLKQKGVAIVYISHRLQEIPRIADRVTVLRDGKYVATRHVSEASLPDLVHLMVDRELEDHFPKEVVPPGEELLRVINLTRGKELRNISFSLRAGEVLGMAGLVGAGRTSVARALFGVDRIDSGEVRIRGQVVQVSSPAAAIRHGMGFLTEDRKDEGLVLSLSAQNNISLASLDRVSHSGVINRSEEKDLAGRFFEKLRIKATGPHQLVAHLSGGNQQKVVLGKWLARNADILIFDEPTRGIDVGSKVEIYRLMNELTEQGAGIIMISSELPEVLGMSDRILVMRDGGIEAELAREEADQEKIVAAALGQAGSRNGRPAARTDS
jgi:ribose transport system ATP-binding protein